jgi:hypothetical protein
MKVAQKSKVSCAVPRFCFSLQSHSVYVAKPSLSQICAHVSTTCRSPTHWCASSCTTTASLEEPDLQKPGEYVVRVCVSRAKSSVGASGTMPPDVEKGYGPKMLASNARICGCRSRSALAYVPLPGMGATFGATVQVFGFVVPSGRTMGAVQPSRTSPSASNAGLRRYRR